MVDEPELYVMRFPDDPEYRAERERQRFESRRRHRGRLALALIELGLSADDAPAWSESLLDRLFVTIPAEGGDPCSCSCHPQLPSTDFHDYGDNCSCQLTAAERRQRWVEWLAEDEAARRTPARMAERARRQAERDEVEDWVAGEPDVVVTRFGGLAPELWWAASPGTVSTSASGTSAGRSSWICTRQAGPCGPGAAAISMTMTTTSFAMSRRGT